MPKPRGIALATEECCKDFFAAIQDLLKQVVRAQEQGIKGPIQYICVSCLQSSLYTGSYLLRIDAYDERQFGDLADAYVYWSPAFIFQYMDSDMAHFRKHIGQHVLRVQKPEIMRFVARYRMHYDQIAQQFIADLIIPLIQTLGISAEKDLVVTFGGYLDETVALTEREE